LKATPSKTPLLTLESENMKRILIGGITIAIIGTLTNGIIQWKNAEKHTQELRCGEAREALKGVEVRARALAAGMTVDAYAKAEEDEVAKLVGALDAATNDVEIDSVIESHASAIGAEDAAIDAEVDTRGNQAFLEQRLRKQRIPGDVKQELERAAKAVKLTCS
jgi:hypothetical protein